MPPLSYDFDMVSVMPDEVFADPALRALLKDAGITRRMPGNRIALFRDPRTVAALRAGPQSIRDWLRASGFGETAHPSGIPAGQYHASDEQDRLRITHSLTANVAKFPLPRAGSPEALGSGFKLAEFLNAIIAAEPVADAVLDATPHAPTHAAPQTAPSAPPLRRHVLLAVVALALGTGLSHLVADRMDALTTATLGHAGN
ncbi:MAG: hypothetical protein MUF73_11045 [Rhodobacteraceae bacterium]|jgi:hypothetical protein|nr:hypothetical protein [Paracoccaceae bacterium]